MKDAKTAIATAAIDPAQPQPKRKRRRRIRLKVILPRLPGSRAVFISAIG